MPYLSITQPDRHTPLRMTLCLTKEECALLRPFVERAHRAAKKKYCKLWLATRGKKTTMKQMYAMLKAEDKFEELEILRYHVGSLSVK